MKKIRLIIMREFLTRVRKKSFLVMTILGPILMASLWVIPILLMTQSDESRKVMIIDDSGLFFNKIKSHKSLLIFYDTIPLHEAKASIDKGICDVVLYIPKTEVVLPTSAVIYSREQLSIQSQSYLQDRMAEIVEEMKMISAGIDKNILASIKTKINLTTIKIDEEGNEEKSYAEIAMILGIFGGILIYFFVFIFSSQVMRGVIEEKSNRIIEVIVSSVKPFQLMMGKIIGIAMVGLTQFLLWVILTFGLVTVAKTVFSDQVKIDQVENMVAPGGAMVQNADKQSVQSGDEDISEILESLNSINYVVIIFSFLFYFIGGYLLYAALFAAIGSAVDNEADTQQFMLPVSAPLILAIVVAQFMMMNPDGPVAFWFSMIPFTSPVAMMVRIPFGVPVWQIGISMALLVAGFIFTTWLAAKIYRTGILMYGKKVNYAELWKWLTYKQ